MSEITPVRRRPWADLWRIEAADGRWWLKVNKAGTVHEPALLRLLGDRPHPLVPRSHVHPSRPWSLIADAGVPVRERASGVDRAALVAFWCDLMADYADLQRSLPAADLLAVGVPDFSTATLPDRLHEVLARTEWFEPPAAELDAAQRAALETLGPALAVAADALAHSGTGVRDGLQHDDLHDANVLVSPAGGSADLSGRRVIDWGDAVVAHPFATLRLTLDSLAEDLAALPGDLDPEAGVARVRSAYLEGWRTGGTSEADLLAEASLVRWTACLLRASCWIRALGDVDTGLAAGSAGSAAGWLGRMLEERPDGLTAAAWTP
ncbi:hypothetical protein FHX74_000807 [Friedmanniella endophytica]|uniref:Phosphotransferase enzyme family protein n=1 Tax=Microlunatus kandeliicorticis TaxID=1759536 RepID=A0A7W3P4S4_9ACTN|nr:phosphotransferase [Microlunatus kandeliicorticis]MBA8793213.1 hypothetical protein [Microlunatus kandeliicorticis]